MTQQLNAVNQDLVDAMTRAMIGDELHQMLGEAGTQWVARQVGETGNFTFESVSHLVELALRNHADPAPGWEQAAIEQLARDLDKSTGYEVMRDGDRLELENSTGHKVSVEPTRICAISPHFTIEDDYLLAARTRSQRLHLVLDTMVRANSERILNECIDREPDCEPLRSHLDSDNGLPAIYWDPSKRRVGITLDLGDEFDEYGLERITLTAGTYELSGFTEDGDGDGDGDSAPGLAFILASQWSVPVDLLRETLSCVTGTIAPTSEARALSEAIIFNTTSEENQR